MPEEGFLDRWSRLKRENKEKPDAEPAPPDLTEQVKDDGCALQAPLAAAPAEEIDEELVASLPKLEDFTPQTNLADFMRKGVPQALRLAALRKAWVLDPAIRDFVNDARDYAYDWNTPGGAPGYGPLNATADELKSMLRQVMGEHEAGAEESVAQEASVSQPGSLAASDDHGIQSDESGQDQQNKDESNTALHHDVASLESLPEQLESKHEFIQETKMESEAYVISRRRHGSAAPR